MFHLSKILIWSLFALASTSWLIFCLIEDNSMSKSLNLNGNEFVSLWISLIKRFVFYRWISTTQCVIDLAKWSQYSDSRFIVGFFSLLIALKSLFHQFNQPMSPNLHPEKFISRLTALSRDPDRHAHLLRWVSRWKEMVRWWNRAADCTQLRIGFHRPLLYNQQF